MSQDVTTPPPTPEQEQQQQPVSTLQILIKFMIDSQNNINKLIGMQEQQMVYINTMYRHVINESGNNVNNNNNSTVTASPVSTETGNKPSNNQPIPKEN